MLIYKSSAPTALAMANHMRKRGEIAAPNTSNPDKRTLRVGDREFAPVVPEVWSRSVSGLQVVKSRLDDIRPKRYSKGYARPTSSPRPSCQPRPKTNAIRPYSIARSRQRRWIQPTRSNRLLRPIEVKPLPEYRIWIEYEDGESGEIDLSHLSGKGVFKAWDKPGYFGRVHISPYRAIAWDDDIDLCADALYMELTGKIVEEIMPGVQQTLHGRHA